MELFKKTRRFFLSYIPSRWWSPLLLGLGLGGIVLAAFTFTESSSTFPYRIWTFFLPSSLHSQENPQQEKPNPYFMPHINQSVSSSDDQSSPSSSVEAPSHHRTDPHNDDSGFSSSAESNPPYVNDTGRMMGHGSHPPPVSSPGGNKHAFPRTSHDTEVADCDIYTGKWVEDNTYPLYKPDSCPYVAERFNCQQFGRPDAKYTRWRWAPRDCELPRFSGRVMLENLRGKRLVFVGDSLNKNQWDSMLCMLSESLADKSRIAHRNRGLKFLDYNCSVEFYTAQYLVDKKEGSKYKTKNIIIRLDTIHKSEKKWRNANVLVFNTAHWWEPGKIGKGENIFQVRDEVYGKLDVKVAYRKALLTWAKWVDTHVNPHITRVFFRTYSPQHFRKGKWDSGGHCEDQTEPIHGKSSSLKNYPFEMKVLEEVLQAMKVPVHVLNITNLSAYRKDAHPSLYWHPQYVVQPHQDCGHWCLPGLPDTWNELLYFVLTKQMSPSSQH